MVRRRVRQFSFTLTELLVVISILGTLAALLMPALSSAMATSQRTACASQLRQLGMAFAGYTADSGGALPRSWDFVQDTNSFYNCLAAGYFQNSVYTITGTGSPASPTSGYPYTSTEFGLAYYSYLNQDAVYTCPTQFRLQTKAGTFQPQAKYIPAIAACSNSTALVYNHYRQNPYFGHVGHGPGNLLPPGIPCTGCASAGSSAYPVSAQLNMIRKPDSTVLNFDVSPFKFGCPYIATPAIANPYYTGGAGGDPTYILNYSSWTYFPNIGFIHGSAGTANRYLGNFSFVDGHVGTMTSDILTDTTDYVFLLKK